MDFIGFASNCWYLCIALSPLLMYCFVSLFSRSFPLIRNKAFCSVLIKFVSSRPLPSSLKLFESQTLPFAFFFTMIHQLAKKLLVQLVNTFIHYSTRNCEQYRKILNNYNPPQVTFMAQSWAIKFSWLKYSVTEVAYYRYLVCVYVYHICFQMIRVLWWHRLLALIIFCSHYLCLKAINSFKFWNHTRPYTWHHHF